MGDVVFLAILVAFFALAVVFVRACDRIVGPETEAPDVADAAPDEAAAA
ncbi:MAG: hypothetical protein ACXVWF_10340 [Actinomycetota bacterium]